ncbi:hypothetical protein Vpro01_04194 [Vibrio proteolyticus]
MPSFVSYTLAPCPGACKAAQMHKVLRYIASGHEIYFPFFHIHS